MSQKTVRMINEEEIKNILLNKGFIPQDDKIVILDEQNNKKVSYIKILTESGQKAFVDLTNITVIPKSETNLMEKLEKVSQIPFSIKNGSIQCVGNKCGIAFECDDEICVISQDNNFKTVEMIFSPKKDEETITLIGKINSIAFPVILFDDLVENPVLVSENIYKISNRLKLEHHRNCTLMTTEMNKSFGEMSNNYSKMILTYQFAFNILTKTINFIDNVRLDSSLEKDNYQILYNLTKRYELLDNLLEICSDINKFKRDFESINKNISKIISSLDNSYSNLETILKE